MALSAPKCNLKPVVELIVEIFRLHLLKGEASLYEWKYCTVLLWFMGVSRRSKGHLNLATAMNGICWQTDHVEVFEFPRFNVAVFLSLAFGCLSHCPEIHGVVWWNVGLGWLLIINGTSPSLAALPRPPATWRLGDLNSLCSFGIFPLYVSCSWWGYIRGAL